MRAATASVAVVLALTVAPSAAAAPVQNGGFETGSLPPWTSVDEGNGSWVVYQGTTLPISGSTFTTPPQGTFAAATDQLGPGSHILYQDLVLEPQQGHFLTFTHYYNNQAAAFATPSSLEHTVNPNQQYRVDIIKTTAPVDSVADGDILEKIFQTQVGDPNSLPPTAVSVDLSPLAGQTVRLRFAEVDNQGPFHVGVDAVELVSGACAGLPATHIGTPGDDTITGTPGNDVVVAGDGNDTIDTLGGHDVVCAGGGNDIVQLKSGNDGVLAGPGNDIVRGGSGSDALFGQGGRDRLLGQGGPDLVAGGGGRDTVKGGSGTDVVRGNGGKDNVRGQGGGDLLAGGPGPDKLVGGAGEDVLRGQGGNDNLNGGADTDTCRQGAGTGILRNCER